MVNKHQFWFWAIRVCESAAAAKMTLTLLHVVMMMNSPHTHHQTLKSRRELSQRWERAMREAVFPAFPLSIKFTINPSMQLSRIREKPGVSIFQLHTDNQAGGLQALWWHHPCSNYGAHVLADQGSGQSLLCLTLTVLCRQLSGQRQPSEWR